MNNRLSAVQKDILFILHALAERKGMVGPVPAVRLMKIVNQGRFNTVADTNFRRSCHTLVASGQLEKYRDQQSLKLAFRLSDKGRATAAEIHAGRMEG